MQSRPKLKVMTYNVMLLFRFLGDYDQKNRSKTIGLSLMHEAEDTQPDVIIFTEMFGKYRENIINFLKLKYPYCSPCLGKQGSNRLWNDSKGRVHSSFLLNGGVMIMSKYPLTCKVQYIFKNKAFNTPDYYVNKGAVYVKLKKDGYLYHIVGTHMQADHGSHLNSIVRTMQLREMKEFIESLKIPKEDPVIVGGDFNIPYADDLKQQYIKEILGGGYNYSQKPHHGSFSAITNDFTKSLAAFMDYPLTYDHTLDYIVYLQDYLKPTNYALMEVIQLKSLTPLYWKYIKNKLPDTKGYYNDPSDHYPVRVEYHYS